MIGDIIKARRTRQGWTQEQLAERLNVTKATVSKWELGQCSPDIGTLPSLGDLFGISMDELLEYKQAKKVPEEETVWWMNLYDTDAWARLNRFTADLITEIQKHMRDKDFLDIEEHRMVDGERADITHYWTTGDEVISFHQGDAEAVRAAAVRLCEKGIYGHIT